MSNFAPSQSFLPIFVIFFFCMIFDFFLPLFLPFSCLLAAAVTLCWGRGQSSSRRVIRSVALHPLEFSSFVWFLTSFCLPFCLFLVFWLLLSHCFEAEDRALPVEWSEVLLFIHLESLGTHRCWFTELNLLHGIASNPLPFTTLDYTLLGDTFCKLNL